MTGDSSKQRAEYQRLIQSEAKERKNDKAANMRVKACASKSLGSLFG